MRRVAGYSVWIGHALDVADMRQIHSAGVEALVDLAINEPVPRISRELIYCRFPIVDGAGNRPELLRLAVRTTAWLIEANLPTLVFCSAGMSRSPAVVAAALSFVTGRAPQDCLTNAFAGGPNDLSSGLWADLEAIVAKCRQGSSGIATAGGSCNRDVSV